MKEIALILCDDNREYVQKLIVYLRKQEQSYSIRHYADVNQLLEEHPGGDCLLIDESLYESYRTNHKQSVIAGHELILCHDRESAQSRDRIYKYQSAQSIARAIMGRAEAPDELSHSEDATLTDRKRRIREDVIRRLSRKSNESEEAVYRAIDECLLLENQQHPMKMEERQVLRRELFYAIKGMDVLQDLLENPNITEIMVNGPRQIFIERDGKLYETGRSFESEEKLLDIIRRIVSDANRSVNMASPIVDARLKDGSRVNAILNPVALNGPILTIRRFGDTPITAEQLVAMGSISEECREFLATLVKARYNILISGGTGAGKTTFLNVLSSYIPEDERIITIEDSAELQLRNIRNLVRLEARMETAEGVKAISIRDLIKTALRSRPDRVIVGEVRGEEAIDMLQALNIGQDGSMSTIHANSAEDALYRLETLIMLSSEIPLKALRRQIASGIDAIVHLGRLRDKSRHVLEVLEVLGMKENEIVTQSLFEFREEEESVSGIVGVLEKRNALVSTDKLKRAGLWNEL